MDLLEEEEEKSSDNAFDDYDYEEEIKRMYPNEDEREEFVTQGL
jgi:hypothetical protein